MTQPLSRRWFDLLTACLAYGLGRGYLFVFALLFAALATRLLGLQLLPYLCFAALVVTVGLFVAACGFWVWVFAFALFRRRREEEGAASAYSGLVIFLAAGTFLVYCGVAT